MLPSSSTTFDIARFHGSSRHRLLPLIRLCAHGPTGNSLALQWRAQMAQRVTVKRKRTRYAAFTVGSGMEGGHHGH
jgi:hypothetical protein